jgi:hypothetical protein
MHEVPAHAIEVRGADQLGPAILELGVYLLDCGQQFLAAAGKGYWSLPPVLRVGAALDIAGDL